jgi:hypothetical protein
LDISTTNLIVSAVAGLVSGVFGSLAAPWVKWMVEKRKGKLEAQRALLDAAIRKVERDDFGPVFLESSEYARLRPHLTEHAVNVIEWRSPLEARDGDRKKLVLDEIARLEREWDLV